MSQIAASAMAPFVTATAAGMFGFKSFTQLSEPRDLERIFETVEYTRWRSFRESPDSRYVVMTMPHVLARLPYGFNTRKIDEFDFEEVEQGADGSTAKKTAHEKYCWMNSAYVYAVRLTSAFSKTNWCTQVVGKENGGTIEGLPVHIFESDAGDKKIKCPTEVAITDRRDAELGKLGFMPLCWYKNTDYAVFFGTQTVHKAKKYVAAADNANSELSAMLPYIMASSRLGHFLKMIARDKQGSFMEASDCEKWLQDWVSQYVLADNNPSPQMKASYPLRECKVMVTADPKRPGVYGAQILLRPWLMMRELNAALSMVADLPKT